MRMRMSTKVQATTIDRSVERRHVAGDREAASRNLDALVVRVRHQGGLIEEGWKGGGQRPSCGDIRNRIATVGWAAACAAATDFMGRHRTVAGAGRRPPEWSHEGHW